MANNKSTPVIVIGIAVFIVGAGLAFVLLHGSSKSKTKTPVAAAVTTTTLGPNAVVVGATAAAPVNFAFQIPAGKNAVAIQVSALAGIDGFAKAGDVVNIFANVSKGRIPGALTPPLTKLIASDVGVLEVLSPAPTSAPAGTAVYLLALDPVTAEQVIFFNTNESLYFTLVPKNAPPALTPGRSYQNAA
jgi:hypothetical protein